MSGFLTYKLGKLVLVGLAALVWGIYCGVKGLDLSGRPERRGPRD